MHDIFELTTELAHLLELLKVRSTKEFLKKLSLIVIDSLGALFTPVMYSEPNSQQKNIGQMMMSQVSHLLNDLSKIYHIPILFANGTVLSTMKNHYVSNGPSLPSSQHLKPALGLTFTYISDKTLFMSDPGGYEASFKVKESSIEQDQKMKMRQGIGNLNENENVKQRKVELIRSRETPTSLVALLTMKADRWISDWDQVEVGEHNL